MSGLDANTIMAMTAALNTATNTAGALKAPHGGNTMTDPAAAARQHGTLTAHGIGPGGMGGAAAAPQPIQMESMAQPPQTITPGLDIGQLLMLLSRTGGGQRAS